MTIPAHTVVSVVETTLPADGTLNEYRAARVQPASGLTRFDRITISALAAGRFHRTTNRKDR